MRTTDLAEIPSPYTEGVFDHLMKANPNENWVALWETNRGCPFSCSYCVWGASTNKRVYQRDIKELYREIDWFSINKIEFIFCCDANFGIFQGIFSWQNTPQKIKINLATPMPFLCKTQKTQQCVFITSTKLCLIIN